MTLWQHDANVQSYRRDNPGTRRDEGAFIRKETVRELLRLLPEQLTADLDVGTLQKLPGACVDWSGDVREIQVDSPWSVDYLPGRRRRSGTPVLMIEMLSHPYPRVAQRLRRYASMLFASLCRTGSVEEEPPLIMPMLLYNGLPVWTPRSFDQGWNRFEYTFVDVRRLPPRSGQGTRPGNGVVEPRNRRLSHWSARYAEPCTGRRPVTVHPPSAGDSEPFAAAAGTRSPVGRYVPESRRNRWTCARNSASSSSAASRAAASTSRAAWTSS